MLLSPSFGCHDYVYWILLISYGHNLWAKINVKQEL
jgi:hypothetical protein